MRKEFSLFKSSECLKLIYLIYSNENTTTKIQARIGEKDHSTLSEQLGLLEKHKIIKSITVKNDKRKKEYVFVGFGNAFFDWFILKLQNENIPREKIKKEIEDFLKSEEGKKLFISISLILFHRGRYNFLGDFWVSDEHIKNLNDIFSIICLAYAAKTIGLTFIQTSETVFPKINAIP